jgi:hypothetical protein
VPEDLGTVKDPSRSPVPQTDIEQNIHTEIRISPGDAATRQDAENAQAETGPARPAGLPRNMMPGSKSAPVLLPGPAAPAIVDKDRPPVMAPGSKSMDARLFFPPAAEPHAVTLDAPKPPVMLAPGSKAAPIFTRDQFPELGAAARDPNSGLTPTQAAAPIPGIPARPPVMAPSSKLMIHVVPKEALEPNQLPAVPEEVLPQRANLPAPVPRPAQPAKTLAPPTQQR